MLLFILFKKSNILRDYNEQHFLQMNPGKRLVLRVPFCMDVCIEIIKISVKIHKFTKAKSVFFL